MFSFIFTCLLNIILNNNYVNMKNNKNKTLHIKVILRTYTFKNIKNKLKIFQILQEIFILQNIVFKNYF